MRKKFKSEDSIERQKILEKFEAVCAMLALDLIGVKVFRYSDETAEAVASGEKLLKESGTIYESFADMMSPEDAKRYLDFLENGSREGLTSAELAGVEKADALLVSQKVEYEDVWDLRNAGDLLESGSVTKPNQVHHYATNKSKTYTPQLEEIANRYELDLDDAWNKDLLPHQGRHPNAYHEYVLDSMKQFDNIAQGDKDIFLKLFDNLKNNVKSKPDMLYKDYWK